MKSLIIIHQYNVYFACRQVLDRDGIGKDDLIGEALIPFSSFDFLQSPIHTGWYELKAEVSHSFIPAGTS